MNTTALIRPAWTPATIALMVIGFMVFWPLGLAMLAYIIWGDRLDGFKRDVNRATDGIFAGCRSSADKAHRWGHGSARTGNVAFDDWRDKELERLAEERRKLDEMLAEFDEYARELRRAKDQEEFDRFMANRNKSNAAGAQAEGEPKGDNGRICSTIEQSGGRSPKSDPKTAPLTSGAVFLFSLVSFPYPTEKNRVSSLHAHRAVQKDDRQEKDRPLAGQGVPARGRRPHVAASESWKTAAHRQLTLRIDAGGRALRVTVPPGLAHGEVNRFLKRQQDWLEERLAKLPKRPLVRPGIRIPLRGVAAYDRPRARTARNRHRRPEGRRHAGPFRAWRARASAPPPRRFPEEAGQEGHRGAGA